jgi:heavy metal sensor kinase
MSLSIGTRLTLSYATILLVILLIFGLIVDIGMRTAINAGIDHDLQIRLDVLETFLNERRPKVRTAHLLEEHSALRPGGDTMQISDQTGAWIFQSDTMRSLHLPIEHQNAPKGPRTRILQGVPVRVLAAVAQAGDESYYIQLATTLVVPSMAVDRFRKLMIALIPFMVLTASSGGYWLSRRALAPVDEIIQDARSITFQNISRRLQVPDTKDELHRLAVTLNEMMQRLELAFRRVTQFTADASHELRTPIALIRGTAEVTLLAERQPKAYQSALADILLEAERTTKLIENLLTLARADSGSLPVAWVPVDLTGQLLSACIQAAASAGAKHLNFSQRIPEEPAEVRGHADMLRQLFLILIDNAIKYTPSGGDIEVELAMPAEGTQVIVRDSGIGIAQDDLDHIFERFYRVDKVRQRDSGGVGLGLSIARSIAGIHSADISVESKLNAGSTFRVRFPSPGAARS